MYNKLRAGDTLIIMSIDRLGRDYDTIGRTWQRLANTKKVNIKILDIPILNTTNNTLVDKLLSDIILQLLAYVAQTEREITHQRQAEGIAAAKIKGVRFGRPEYPIPPDFQAVCEECKSGKLSIRQAASKLGMNPSTFYRKYKKISDKSVSDSRHFGTSK